MAKRQNKAGQLLNSRMRFCIQRRVYHEEDQPLVVPQSFPSLEFVVRWRSIGCGTRMKYLFAYGRREPKKVLKDA